MHVTYCDDHDWENNATYDLENLFDTNFENDGIDNCYTVGNIHVSSNHNVENPKLGDDGFENPFGIESHDDLFTKIYAWKDDYPLAYDDIMPPIFDDYCDDNYAIKNDFNHPYETRHNYYSPTEHHISNTQLVYHVQVLYDSPTLNATNNKDFTYVESNNNTFMHVNHEKILYVMVMLLSFLMILLKVIMREGSVVI